MPDDKLLRIYLNDHLAAVVGGIELAYRCLSQNRNSPLGDYVTELLPELQEQRTAIIEVLRALDARVTPFKTGLGWLGEKVGRLKLNGQLTGYSDLSRLEEIEWMCRESSYRQLMWMALAEVGKTDARLEDFDFIRLAERSRIQREGLENYRIDAARTAFNRRPSPPRA